MWNMKKFPQQWQELITVTIYKQGDKTDCGNYSGISLFSITQKILHKTLLAWLIPHVPKITGTVNVDLNVTGQVLIVQPNLVIIP
jgi:hypothetical protein